MSDDKKTHNSDIDMDDKTPIDLKGAEQHHKLKNQPGENGDPDHATQSEGSSDETDSSVTDAIDDNDPETAVGSALKKAAKD